MVFSWIVLALGLLGPLVVLSADWAVATPLGQTGHRHHHLSWYSPLPLVGWLAALGAVAYFSLPD